MYTEYFAFEVTSPMAYFENPLSNQMSYPIPTPSAIIGMCHNILRYNNVEIVPVRCEVIQRGDFHRYTTNYAGAYRHKDPTRLENTQRSRLILCNPKFRIVCKAVQIPLQQLSQRNRDALLSKDFTMRQVWAHLPKDKTTQERYWSENNYAHAYIDLFARRVKREQEFRPVYLGDTGIADTYMTALFIREKTGEYNKSPIHRKTGEWNPTSVLTPVDHTYCLAIEPMFHSFVYNDRGQVVQRRFQPRVEIAKGVARYADPTNPNDPLNLVA